MEILVFNFEIQLKNNFDTVVLLNLALALNSQLVLRIKRQHQLMF